MISHARTNRLLIFAVIAALASCGAYAGLFYFVNSQMQQLAEQKEKLDAASIEAQEARALRSLVRSTEEERIELQSRYPTTANLVNFLEELEQVGIATGALVTIRSVEEVERMIKGDRKKEIKHQGLEISLTATGSWSSVYHTLLLIESLPYPIVIENVTVDTNPEFGWAASMRMGVATQ